MTSRPRSGSFRGLSFGQAANLLLPVVFLVVFVSWRLRALLDDLRADVIPVRLGFEDVPGDFTDRTLTVSGTDLRAAAVVDVEVPVQSVSTLALVLHLVSWSVLTLGVVLLVALALRPLLLTLRGEFFSRRVQRWTTGLFSGAIGVWFLWFVGSLLAANTVAGDLGVPRGVSTNTNMESTLVPFVVILIGLAVQLVSNAQKKGRAAEDDLEGIV